MIETASLLSRGGVVSPFKFGFGFGFELGFASCSGEVERGNSDARAVVGDSVIADMPVYVASEE